MTLRLATRRVRVAGNVGRVPGTTACTRVTQPWMAPMRQVWHGVMGSQDLNVCGRH